MADARADARWTEAVPLTAALWLFMLLIYLPALIARHSGDSQWTSILLDASTILVSMAFGLTLFSIFRVSVGLRPFARFATIALAVVAAAALQTLFDLAYTAWVARNLRSSWSAVPVDLSRASASMLNYVSVFTVNASLFQMSFSRHRSVTRERRLAAAESHAQRAQLEALRLQLNPHFLFNTLNSISALIVTHRNEDAERMTDRLSSFLRASLAFDPARLVAVEEEFELIGEYLEIEGVRFGERLLVEISCAEEARDVLVPGMLMQPLVENAIKYGVARSREPTTVEIAAALADGMLCLRVANGGGGGSEPPGKTGSAGVGLENVTRRLRALYGERASLRAEPVGDGFVATIRMPTVPPALAG